MCLQRLHGGFSLSIQRIFILRQASWGGGSAGGTSLIHNEYSTHAGTCVFADRSRTPVSKDPNTCTLVCPRTHLDDLREGISILRSSLWPDEPVVVP